MTYNSRNVLEPWPPLLAQQLEHWHSLTTITAAEVVLEHQRGDGRAFRVKVRLDVPGPSLRTQASDSTLEAALLLATRDLERQIQAKKTKPIEEEKNRPQAGANSGPEPNRRTGGRKISLDRAKPRPSPPSSPVEESGILTPKRTRRKAVLAVPASDAPCGKLREGLP